MPKELGCIYTQKGVGVWGFSVILAKNWVVKDHRVDYMNRKVRKKRVFFVT